MLPRVPGKNRFTPPLKLSIRTITKHQESLVLQKVDRKLGDFREISVCLYILRIHY